MTIVVRALAAALIAGAAFTAGPLLAQGKKAEAPKPPKLSKPVAAVLVQVQTLQQAGDHAGALAKLKETDTLPKDGPDDTATILRMKLQSAAPLKDNALIEDTLTSLLALNTLPAADQTRYTRIVAELAANRKDYEKAYKTYETVLAATPDDADALVGASEVYFRMGQKQKAVDSLSKAIRLKEAIGTKPDENWYRRTVQYAYDGKLTTAVQPALMGWIKAYPSATAWRDAIRITQESHLSGDDQVQLDFMRLQAVTGALNGERDFVEYADTALGKGLPGEAKYAIDEGVKRNMLSPSKPLVAELQKSANAKVATDKASLPGLEKEIKGNPKLALATGDAYYGYADFAKAAALYRQAVGVPTVDQATANLRLGMALARAGDKTGAMAALQAVKGGPREALAQYWLVYLGQTG
jgi:predicted Zn-dependent protease